MSAPEMTHVTFGRSAAHGLEKALNKLSMSDDVVAVTDDLSVGPINTVEPGMRHQWFVNEMGFDEDVSIPERIEQEWNRAAGSSRGGVIVWISSRSVTEYCGFLELLWRFTDTQIRVVDVASTSMAFSWVATDNTVNTWLSKSALVTREMRDGHRLEWERLRHENGVLRVLTSSGIVSEPITYFDDLIVSCTSDAWWKCGRVVGDAVAKASAGPFRQCSSDVVFFERLLALVDEGRIEGRRDGELWSLSGSLVRRVASDRVDVQGLPEST